MSQISREFKWSMASVSNLCKFFRLNGSIPALKRIESFHSFPEYESVKKYIEEAYDSKGYIEDSWAGLVRRIRIDFPCFRGLSFKKLVGLLKNIFDLRLMKMRPKPKNFNMKEVVEMQGNLLRMLEKMESEGLSILYLDEAATYTTNLKSKAIGFRKNPPRLSKTKANSIYIS